MKKFWKIAASYARCLALAMGTAAYVTMKTMGRLPTSKDDWMILGAAAVFAAGPVIWRWLDPNDPAYGRGSK